MLPAGNLDGDRLCLRQADMCESAAQCPADSSILTADCVWNSRLVTC